MHHITSLCIAVLLAGCTAPAAQEPLPNGVPAPAPEPEVSTAPSEPAPHVERWTGEVTIGLPPGLAATSEPHSIMVSDGEVTVAVEDRGGLGAGGWWVSVQRGEEPIEAGPAPLAATLTAGTYDVFVTVQGDGVAVQREFEATATWAIAFGEGEAS